MASNSLNSDLHSLVRLQELDLKIRELQDQVQRIPEQIQQLEARVSGSRHSLDEAADRVDKANRERKQLERDAEDLRLKLSKYKDQLMEVKTNEAYQAMLHEIEFAETQISRKEDEILERMLMAEELLEHKTEVEREVRREGEEVELRVRELQQFATRSESTLQQLQREKQEVESKLPLQLIEQYQRIAARRNGIAVVEVSDHCCQGCHVRLRPQLCAEIKTKTKILTCENCNRILFYASS